jgi:Tfp pilus assembly protein PilO
VTKRDRIMIAVIIVAVAVGGGWLGVAKPKREEVKQLDAKISAAQSDLAGSSARAGQYRAARASLRQHPEAFAKAGTALPNRIATPELLRTLTQAAKGTGVTMTDFKTAAGTDSTPGITSVGLQLSFTGEFVALQRYLSRLQRLVAVSRDKVEAKGRLVALKSVKLAPGEGHKLTATVTAAAYVLQPGGLAVGSAAAPAATPAPASAAASTATPTTPTTPASPSTTAGGA